MSRLPNSRRYAPQFPPSIINNHSRNGSTDSRLPNHSRMGSCSPSNAMRHGNLDPVLRPLPGHILELPLHTDSGTAIRHLPLHDSVSAHKHSCSVTYSLMRLSLCVGTAFMKQNEERTTPRPSPPPTSKLSSPPTASNGAKQRRIQT